MRTPERTVTLRLHVPWTAESSERLHTVFRTQDAAEGLMSSEDFPNFEAESGFRPADGNFIEGVVFDAREPNAYLREFAIGHKD